MNTAEFRKKQLEKSFDDMDKKNPNQSKVTKAEFVKIFIKKDFETITNALKTWTDQSKKEYKSRFNRIIKERNDLENLLKTL